MTSIILHIDMNSYFASCEQQANPFLRGRPVGVCAYLSEQGCIIASSIEAKKKGVKTGCRVKEAKQLCPDIFLMENEPAKYRSITKKIFSILAEYTDKLEPYSIDEAFLDLTGWSKNFKQAKEKAKEIKDRIKNEVGDWLKASVGLSYTRWLAKFASDQADKDSILIIKKDNLDKFLKRPLTSAWGINYRLESRLKSLGIFNLLDLKKYPVANLMQVLGRPGYYLWANVNGLPTEKVKKQKEPKSVGHSYCLYQKSKDIDYLSSVLLKLCEKTGRRLRLLEKEAHSISFGLRFKNGGGLHQVKRIKNGLFTTKSIFRTALKIMSKIHLYEEVSFLAISVSHLWSISRQMSLFKDNLKEKEISLAMDKINDQYGQYLVYWGSMHGTDKVARDRIGFRKTVNTN
ncbi:MAG: DNA polymerase IV [Patescibacteria group bacterium]|nr:DNA polymerase IV [Patescibacteria group bacterium]